MRLLDYYICFSFCVDSLMYQGTSMRKSIFSWRAKCGYLWISVERFKSAFLLQIRFVCSVSFLFCFR